ncbi:MAG: hypothetical protein AAF610_01910 [Pseudomonadota bacterium]
MSLRHAVERALPNWETWYPSLFDAAVDLGLIKAEVCSPDDLLLSRRHSAIKNQAIDAHRENWGGVLQDVVSPRKDKPTRRRRRRR